MTQTVDPFKNIITKYVFIDFGEDCGWFGTVDMVKFLNAIGYSRAEAKRMVKQRSVKIWDINEHNKWEKRPIKDHDLLEANDIILVGKGYKSVEVYSTEDDYNDARRIEYIDAYRDKLNIINVSIGDIE